MPISTSTGELYESQMHFLMDDPITPKEPDAERPARAPTKITVRPTDSTMPPTTPTEPAGALKPTEGSIPTPDPNASPGRSIMDQLTGADGQERYQLWPERMTREVLDSMRKLGSGEVNTDSPDYAEHAFNVASAFGTGGIATAPMREAGAGIFGGRLGSGRVNAKYDIGEHPPENPKTFFNNVMSGAEQLPMTRAVTAENMLKEGVSPVKVYEQTGWFVGPDGKMRFEISDKGARLKTENLRDMYANDAVIPSWAKEETHYHSPGNILGPGTTMGEILDHPELFKVYPELKDIKIGGTGFNFGVKGWYSYGDKSMAVRGGKGSDMLSTIVHELQHAVQHIEGHAPGANTQMFMPKDEVFPILQQNVSSAEKALREYFDKHNFAEKFKEGDRKASFFDVVYPFEQLAKGGIHSKYMADQRMKQALTMVTEHPEFANAMRDYVRAKEAIEQAEGQAYVKYSQVYGEAEARMAQERQTYDAAERRAVPPHESKTFKQAYPDGHIPTDAVLPDH